LAGFPVRIQAECLFPLFLIIAHLQSWNTPESRLVISSAVFFKYLKIMPIVFMDPIGSGINLKWFVYPGNP